MRELPSGREPFGIGAVMAMSLALLGRSWFKLVVFSLLPWFLGYGCFVAGLFIAYRLLPPGPSGYTALSVGVVASVVLALTYAVCQAAVTHGIAELLHARSFRFGQALRRGLSRFGLMFGIGVLAIAIGLGFGLASAVIKVCLPALAGRMAVPAVLLAGGSLVCCAFFVVLPVAAMEDHNAPGCYARSRFLTRGYRWPIFGLGLLMVLGYGAVEILAAVVGQAVFLPTGAFIVPLIAWIGVLTFANVILAVTYFRLRLLKEGVGLDNIAAVFD